MTNAPVPCAADPSASHTVGSPAFFCKNRKTLSKALKLNTLAVSLIAASLLAACGGNDNAGGGQTTAVASSAEAVNTENVRAATSPALLSAAPSFNYAEALQKSILFYEAQQSGPLPSWNRVSWRGSSRVNDGADVGLDLTGGWYDAGDHVKFGFPMAASATQLAWGMLEFETGYKNAQQYDHMLRNLRFVNDYFIKAHPSPNVLYGQVGNGRTDHSWWGPVEVYPLAAPSYKIDSTCGGSDLAGETAAAMAAASMVFKTSDPTYSATLLRHAKELYTFADTKRQKYSECITDARDFYNSWSGYEDELAWGATWLYRATGDATYLQKAEAVVNPYIVQGTHDWDQKFHGTYVLLARLTGKDIYKQGIENNLAWWTTGVNGSTSNRVKYTPGGMAWHVQWGSLRHSMNASFIAMAYANDVTDAAKRDAYRNFAIRQINYALGDNPRQTSYMVGFGNNFPQHPHHRTAHGGWDANESVPNNHRHTIVGALVGGPKLDDSHNDAINDFIANEVATDYNASFTGALAGAYALLPGSNVALANFPVNETPGEEFFVESNISSSSVNHSEVRITMHNRSAWPARETDKISVRYYLDLSEAVAAGQGASNISVTSGFLSGGAIRALQRCGTSNIYYTTVDMTGVKLAPSGSNANKKEVQIRLAAPNGTTYWNGANDPSQAGLSTSGFVKTQAITMYDNGRKVWGNEPAVCGGEVIAVPAAPVNLSATGGVGKIDLTWSAVTGATGYSVKRSTTGAAGSYSALANVASASYSDTGLSGATRYYYVVTARNSGGESADSVAASATTAATPPATPTLSATAGDQQVALSWNAANGASSYDLARATSASGPFADIKTGITTTSYVNTGLTNDTTYYYRLTARNSAGTAVSSVISAKPMGSSTGGGTGGTTTCSLKVDTSNSWNTGMNQNLTLTNSGSAAITNWTITVTQGAGATFSRGWNGAYTTSGNVVTIKPLSYNGTVAAGASINMGFQVTFTGPKPVPTAASVAGQNCTITIL
jgi:endoglucanase